MVSDWIWHENLRPFLEVVSWLTGYSFDDLDWDAITVGLDEAERTQVDYWFDYPLGDVALRLRDYGPFGPVRFELQGDAEIERRIDVAIMVMQGYEWKKSN
jgi:hypothetical protein